MHDPALTVIIPVYNGHAYLPETVEAVLSQDRGPLFELLIVDDGSTDQSLTYLRSLDDPRIRIIEQNHEGLPATMNRGIEQALAPIIARVDQDDICIPGRMKRQFEYLRANPEVDCVFSLVERFGASRRWIWHDKVSGELLDGRRRYDPGKDGCLLHNTLMGKRDAFLHVGGYRSAFYPSDDWDLLLRLSERCTVHVIPEALVRYRFHAGANTYHYYWKMQQVCRWAEDCARRRIAGQEEDDFDEYLERSTRPLHRHWNNKRKDRAGFYMRKAGQRFLDGHYLSPFWHCLLGALLDPIAIYSRVRNLWRNRMYAIGNS